MERKIMMKNRIVSYIIILTMLFSTISVPIAYAENIGAPPQGTEDDPLLIDSVYSFIDFLELANNQNDEKVYFALVNDIDAWPDLAPIGGYIANNIGFDGNGHELNGFKFTDALFESLNDCNIRNLTFNNISVRPSKTSTDVAVLAKEADSSTFITNCTFKNCTVKLPAESAEVNAATVAVNSSASIANTVVEDTTVFEQTSADLTSDIKYNIGGVVTNNIDIGYIVNTITDATAILASGPSYKFAGAAVYSETNIAYCYSKTACPENVQTFDPHVIEASGQYAEEDFWITREGDFFNVLGGQGKNYSEMSLLEFSAELSELSMNNYNQSFSDYLAAADYAVLWSVEDNDLFFSYDGKTGSVYLYMSDAPLKDAVITFSDTVYTEEIAKNEKYAVRVGVYGESNTYVRNTFDISIYTKDFTMVENYVYRPNQMYVRSLPNEIDGEYYMTYSDMYLNSVNNGADASIPSNIIDTGIINRGGGSIYPFCTTLSLSNIENCDEIVDYRFQGSGSDDVPFLINNFYEIECLANHVKKGKLYFGTERYNRASYRLARDVEYPTDISVLHTPIGTYSSDFSAAFSGAFDGDYHSVTNVTVSGSNSYTGFFGVVAGIEKDYDHIYANIKNLVLQNTLIEETVPELPGDLRGCLAGQLSYTVVNGCFVDSSSAVYGGTQIGGIVGYAYNSELYNCASSAKITTYHPNAWAGGLVGYCQYSTVANGYAANLFETNNIVDTATILIGGIAGSVKKSEFENTFYRADNSADESLIVEGIDTAYLADIRTESFAAELSYYSETHGLGVVWKQNDYKFDQYPYITDEENADYMIFCVPTHYGKVKVQDSNGNEISTAKGNDIVRVMKDNGLIAVEIESYDKKALDVSVSSVTVNGVDYFEFRMPNCAVRITPDYGIPVLSGCGTREEPYMISDYDDLVLMSHLINSNTSPKLDGCDPYLNAYYVVTQDIDCEGQALDSIANTSNGPTSIRFGGDFNGQGYTISNLKIVSDNTNVAFFGYSQGADIYDIRFDNLEVNGNYASALVSTSYGYLGVRNVEVVNSTLNGNTYAVGFVMQSYGTLSVNNCILDNVVYNAPSSAYVLRECDEYVSFSLKNTLILNMSSSRNIFDLSWSTSSITVDNVYHCNAAMTESNKYTVTEISSEMLSDVEFVAGLSRYAIEKLGQSSWGIRKSDSRASLSVLDDTIVVSPITYDSVFTDSTVELFDMDTAPSYACEGDMVEIKYNLRTSTANIKAEVGNGSKKRTAKCLFDGADSGDGFGTMTFNMPGSAVHITNNDQPITVKNFVGKGTESEPYIISNGLELRLFADYVNGTKEAYKPDDSYVDYDKAYVQLINDIDMTGVQWEGIGTDTVEFTGIFDGAYHTISNLNVDNGAGEGSAYGLFNIIGSGAVVRRIYFENAYVFPSEYLVIGSGVVAKQNKGRIAYVEVNNSSVQLGNLNYLGGIAGINCEGGTIEYCAVKNSSITRLWGALFTGAMGGITEENCGMVRGCYTYGCSFNNGNSAKGAIISRGVAPQNCVYYTQSSVSISYGASYTTAEFSSGKAAYFMNNGQTSDSDEIWRQNLGSDQVPVIDISHNIVYRSDNGYIYTNTMPAVYASSPTIIRGSVMVGDINCDGEVTEVDVEELRCFMAGETTLDYFSIIACDVNGDGVIDSADYDAIIAYLENNQESGESLIGTLRSLIGELPEGMVALGDLNRDGIVDRADLEIIEKYISGELVLTEEQRVAANTALRDVIDGLDRDAVIEFLENLADIAGYTGNIGRFAYLNAPAKEQTADKTEPEAETEEPVKKEEKKEDKKPSNPVTGDSFNYILYISTLTISIIGVVITSKELKSKRKNNR